MRRDGYGMAHRAAIFNIARIVCSLLRRIAVLSQLHLATIPVAYRYE